MKQMHETSKTCEKCNVEFAEKQDFYAHLPCQYSCRCGKGFSSFSKYSQHNRNCEKGQPVKPLTEAHYHTVISFQCFICALDGISTEMVKIHVEENHPLSIIGCKSCCVNVDNVSDHIFAKHASVRRMKTSYAKLPPLPPVIAVKSKPKLDVDMSLVSQGGITIKQVLSDDHSLLKA